MGTPKQEKLAKKITENYRGKKTKTLGELLLESDYTKTTSEQPSRIIKGKGIKKALKPALERYEKELSAILNAMELKDKNSEEYKVLVDAADKIQKQVQLLSGGATEKIINISISKEIAEKNALNISTKHNSERPDTI